MSWRTTLLFQPTQLRGIDRRLAERDAVRAHLVRFLDDARGMQQRLRRNAADVQANAAERRPALDERDLETQIRGAKRGRVAAGAGADHGEALAGGRRGCSLGACGCGRARRRRGARRAAAVARRAARAAAGAALGAALGCRLVGRVEHQHEIAGRNLVAVLDRDRQHGAGARRRHVHRRLVGLERDERIFGRDLSPAFTCTSMTSTAGKSPSSGIRTSTRLTESPPRAARDWRGSRRAAS